MITKGRNICLNCEKETDTQFIKTKEAIKVRGEKIELEVEYLKCLECGNEFRPPEATVDPLNQAYREYRRRHSMLQPDEIREQRERYGLTQQEMSKLLGWGFATLSRYENGALQSDAHEKALKLTMEPHNLLKLIQQNPDAISSDDKRERVLKELKIIDAESCTFEKIYLDRFGNYPPDELSGFKRLDLAKLFSAILFFCKDDGLFKTRLNKFLFYADFKNYKNTSVSITGLRYVHLPLGPVPDNYEYYFASLVNERAIRIEEICFDNHCGEKLVSERKPDLALFSDSELKTLLFIKEYFQNMSSKAISEYSHKEKAYSQTSSGDFISYHYADDLSI
jgi:putative zinc finger/helix-turn-helix YgiT family protein